MRIQQLTTPVPERGGLLPRLLRGTLIADRKVKKSRRVLSLWRHSVSFHCEISAETRRPRPHYCRLRLPGWTHTAPGCRQTWLCLGSKGSAPEPFATIVDSGERRPFFDKDVSFPGSRVVGRKLVSAAPGLLCCLCCTINVFAFTPHLFSLPAKRPTGSVVFPSQYFLRNARQRAYADLAADAGRIVPCHKSFIDGGL